jgi:hypothetical protein
MVKEDRPETCCFCAPTVEEILNVVGYRMTKVDLIKMRDHLEALGCALSCGDNKTVCMPLQRTQQQIDQLSGVNRSDV